MTMKQDVQTQNDFLPTCTLGRFYIIYNGVLYGELFKTLDILNKGYACLHIDNSSILINFVWNQNLLIRNRVHLLSLKI